MLGTQGQSLSHNRYTYVENNPFKYTDPTGHFLESVWNGVKNSVATAMSIAQGVGTAAYGLGQAAYGAVTGNQELVAQGLATAKSGGAQVVNTVKQTVNKIITVGQNIVSNVKSTAQKVISTLSNYKDKIKNSSAFQYVKNSTEAFLKGDYYEGDQTALSIAMSVGAGIIGADIALDARDLIHTIDTWEWSWSKAGELGLNLVGFVPVIGSLKNVKHLKHLDEATDSIKAIDKAADTAKAIDKTATTSKQFINSADSSSKISKRYVHGNSKYSTKAQHSYDIYNKNTGEIVKTGVSGSKISQTGKSYRATSQVNKWNKQAGADIYDSKIINIEKAGPNARKNILEQEKARAQYLYSQGHLKDQSKHVRP